MYVMQGEEIMKIVSATNELENSSTQQNTLAETTLRKYRRSTEQKQRPIPTKRSNCTYLIVLKEKKEEQNTLVLFHQQTVVSDPTKLFL